MSVKKVVVTERSVLTDILKMYKDLPCLWDPGHRLYNNKEARDEGLHVLLEKYKLLQADANIESVKKKIENMRCCYKREYKKVLTSTANGLLKHRPSLWYYKYLTFLDDINDKSDNDSNEENDSKRDFAYEEPPDKKANLSSVYLIEEDHLSQCNEEIPIPQDVSFEQLDQDNEAESFGRTVGLQLKQLRPVQRFIAEKLISDVIYYGRLERLNHDSCINLKSLPYD